MKFLQKKGFMQKIVILLVIILTTNFLVPNYSQAKIDKVLIDPIITLVCWTGDGLLNWLNEQFFDEKGIFEDYEDFVESDAAEFLDESDSIMDTVVGGIYSLYANTYVGRLILKETTDVGYEGPVALCKYSIGAIVSNQVPAFDINFFNPNDDSDVESTAAILQQTIQKWYVALRNLAVVMLLSMLVYIGIKIIMSSSSEDKAKYKKMIMNWIVAVCMVFVLHYVMAITLYVTETISDSIYIDGTSISEDGYDPIIASVRYSTEMSDTTQKNLAYTVMYAVLVIDTIIFTFVYFKRSIMIAFLTVIAPLIAVTYPLDKEKDGKSQALDFWMKEYFSNILMQLIHLFLYYIFIISAIDLVNENIIYALVALSFILPAEKIIRNMFAIRGGEDSSAEGGFAAGAATVSALSAVKRIFGGSGKGGGPSRNLPEGESSENTQIKTANPYDDEFFGDDTLNISSGDGRRYRTLPGYEYLEDDVGTATGNNKDSSNTSSTSKRNSNKFKNQNIGNEDNTLSNTSNSTSGVGGTRQNKNSGASNNKKIKKPKSNKSVARGMTSVLKYTASKKPIRRAIKAGAKTGVRLTLGGAGLIMGVAAGIAHGEGVGKFIEHAATGAGAGLGATEFAFRGIKKTAKTVKQESTKIADEAKIGYNNYSDKEYQQNVVIPRIQKENTKKYKEIYRKEFKDNSKKLLNSSTRDELYKAGIVDEKLIINALKIKEKQPGMSDRDLVQCTLIAKKTNSPKDAETTGKRFKEELENRGAFKHLEEQLEKKGAFDDIDRKLQKKFEKIQNNPELEKVEKLEVQERLRQAEKEKIIEKEKDRQIAPKMKVIRKIAGID